MPETLAPPAPAPAAPQPSLPSGIPQLPPSTRAGSNMADSFSRLESFAREPGAETKTAESLPQRKINEKREAAKAAPKPEQAQPKLDRVDTAGEISEMDDAAPSVAETQKDAPKLGEPPKNKPKGDFLREAYAKEKAAREAAEKKIAELTQPKEDPEKIEFKTRAEAAEKRAQEREDRLRQVEYEKSDEYQDKYNKPFQDALAMGQHKVKSFDIVQRTENVVNEMTGETEARVVQKERAATDEDFMQICSLSDDREARRLAKWKFGEDANEVMQHRERVLEANRQRHGALEDFKKNGAEREKLATEQRTKQQREFNDFQAKLRETHFKTWSERYPEAIAVDETDPDGKAIIDRDRAITDRLFRQDHGFSNEKQIELHADMRNRAAHFGLLNHKYKALQKQMSEIQAKLKGYEESEPGEGTGNEPKANGAQADTMKGVLDGMSKYGEARAPRLI